MKKYSFLMIIISSLCLLTTASIADKNRHIQPTEINFLSKLPTDGNLVLGIYEEELGAFGNTVDKNSNEGLTHAIKATEFKAEKMSTQSITAPIGSGFNQILLVGLGKKSDTLTDIEWQNIGGDALQKAVKSFKKAPVIALDVTANNAANFAFGAKLGTY
jgi:leucyl aminopeptidase